MSSFFDLDEGVLFASPEEPSHVAFVGLWQEGDGTVKASFEHLYGNPGVKPSYRPHYGRLVLYNQERSNEEWLAFTKAHRMFQTKQEALAATREQAWAAFCKAHDMSQGPEDAISTTIEEFPILVTRDGGDTWQNLGPNPNRAEDSRRYFLYDRKGKALMPGRAPVRCRDGRILSTVHSGELEKGYLLGVRESLDDGETWLPDQFIRPEGTDEEFIKAKGSSRRRPSTRCRPKALTRFLCLVTCHITRNHALRGSARFRCLCVRYRRA